MYFIDVCRQFFVQFLHIIDLTCPEYVCQVWDPYTLKNIQRRESVQKYMLCISYFLNSLIASHREYLRVLALNKFYCGHSYLPPDILSVQPVTFTRSSASSAYKIPFAHMTQFQLSFLPRIHRLWNNLPHDILDSDPT